MRFRTQQFMIELANRLDRLLQLVIILQPVTNFGNPLATHAELLRTSTGISRRQNKYLVPLATRAFRAVLAVADSALQQRAAEQLASNRQLADKLLAGLKGSATNHSQE